MSESEFNWNKEYSIINLYPPLCPTILVKFILSGRTLANRTLYINDFIGEGYKVFEHGTFIFNI